MSLSPQNTRVGQGHRLPVRVARSWCVSRETAQDCRLQEPKLTWFLQRQRGEPTHSWHWSQHASVRSTAPVSGAAFTLRLARGERAGCTVPGWQLGCRSRDTQTRGVAAQLVQSTGCTPNETTPMAASCSQDRGAAGGQLESGKVITLAVSSNSLPLVLQTGPFGYS